MVSFAHFVAGFGVLSVAYAAGPCQVSTIPVNTRYGGLGGPSQVTDFTTITVCPTGVSNATSSAFTNSTSVTTHVPSSSVPVVTGGAGINTINGIVGAAAILGGLLL
jgi:hypothetical protein